MSFKDQCIYWYNYFRTLHQVNTYLMYHNDSDYDYYGCRGVLAQEMEYYCDCGPDSNDVPKNNSNKITQQFNHISKSRVMSTFGKARYNSLI